MAAHTYWRINASANDGDTSFLAIAEVQMHVTIGGADQCTGGTASASSADGTTPASNAFDDSSTTRWSTPSGTLTGWLAYNFTAGVDVVEYSIQAHPSVPARSPSTWSFEYSDDGSSWTPVETREGQTGWTNGQTRTFTVTTTASARLSQLPVEVLRTNTAVAACLSQLPVEVLRINTGTHIRLSQMAVEVLRPVSAAASSGGHPVIIVTT